VLAEVPRFCLFCTSRRRMCRRWWALAELYAREIFDASKARDRFNFDRASHW
jgi:hypothetical protein